ncbi:uncharacterized protein [Malus domestica]|uniref:uncharacterized protein n=1 Tax=Malus domestica TaxID=3750 RepID=UPI003974F586
MQPHREPHHSAEPSFPDIALLGEAIANAIQSSLRPLQRTPLETMYNLKLNHFIGNEGYEGANKWLNYVEKTFLVMQSQGNLPPDRFIHPEYIDRKKQEFTHLKQRKMSANEYYRKFTDLSRYDPNEFYEVLLQIKDSENMPSESEDEEEKNGNQRQDDKGGLLCRMCNNRLYGECRRGSNVCYTCGQMRHRAAHCPQNQQRPQQPPLPPPAPTQQA